MGVVSSHRNHSIFNKISLLPPPPPAGPLREPPPGLWEPLVRAADCFLDDELTRSAEEEEEEGVEEEELGLLVMGW